MIDDDADEQERAAAQALARALEGDASPAAQAAPSDALKSARLLQEVAARDSLSTERADAVLSTLASDVEKHVQPQQGASSVRWIFASALAAAAALALWIVANGPEGIENATRANEREPAAQASALPIPPASLLAAQSSLQSNHASAEARIAFEREMSAYRSRVLHAIKQRYPVAVGMLEPARPAKERP